MYKRVDGRQKRLELEESESPPAGCGRFFPVALETITDPSKTATNPNG
jgi:sarcosine oxidase delta subunit